MKNTNTQQLITQLRTSAIEQEARLWKRVAEDLAKPSRARRTVNIFKIEQLAKDGDVIIVPGKVLGEGDLTKRLTVAAASFSDSAKDKINKNGEALSIDELLAKNPKAQKVRILG